MPGDDAFQVEGLVVEVLPNGTYRVELANGHRLLGFVPGKRRLNSRPMAAGEKVRVRLSPFDLSVGRILGEPVGG
ncbi:MAG TPA: translation initiation factor IF-1 [Verrucomicrobiae bacterium]